VIRWSVVLKADDTESSAVNRWLKSINRLPMVDSRIAFSHAARVLPGQKGEGDIVWSLIIPDSTRPIEFPAIAGLFDAAGASVRICVILPLKPFADRTVAQAGHRVLRTLLIRVTAGTSPEAVRALELSLTAMPEHITSIRSWALSRINPGSHGDGWTHVWEQEFVDPGGFRAYMAHPYHWTGVERWFDPEIPGFVVDSEAHFMTEVPSGVLGRSSADSIRKEG
jgi:hypothetical protein